MHDGDRQGCVAYFDHHDPGHSRDPYPRYREFRSKCPVTWSDAWGGFWAAWRYGDVVQVARDDDTFRSGVVLPDGTIQGVTIPAVGQARPVIPIEVDPPDFLKYRQLLNPFYSSGRIAQREDEFRALARALIDQVIEEGKCDIVQALAAPLSTIVTLRDLGLPEERWSEFSDWMDVIGHEMVRDRDRALETALNVYVELAVAIDARREGAASGGIIDYLLNSTVDGRPLSEEEIMDMSMLLLLGGLDTTKALTGTALWYLAEHPDERERLLADPSLFVTGVEEFLRYVTPVQCLARTVSRHTQLGGQDLQEGERILIFWASADRDPEEFSNPDELVLDRSPNRHLAFGVGIHRCLGSHLARATFRIMLEEVLSRMPDYCIAEDQTVQWFADVSSVWGVKALPISFTPGRRQAS